MMGGSERFGAGVLKVVRVVWRVLLFLARFLRLGLNLGSGLGLGDGGGKEKSIFNFNFRLGFGVDGGLLSSLPCIRSPG